MKLCKVEVINGAITCAACGVPFAGSFAISASELAAIGGRLERVFRPCQTRTGGAGEPATSLGTVVPPTPIAGGLPAASAALVDYRQCLHRGEVVRSERCSTCRGNVLVKVFACAIHGQCQLSGRVAGVKVCGPDCHEHAVPSG